MIYTRLIGGLGNQMFQYALGRHLAVLNNTTLKLDVSGLAGIAPGASYTVRNYDLGNFAIQENIAAAEETEYFKEQNSSFRKIFHKLKPYHKRPYLREKDFSFDADVLKAKRNVYLDGYWQSEKYFSAIKEIIREEFSLKEPISITAFSLANEIQSSESISLHIRRGDYVTNYSSYYHILGLDYYFKGLERIRQHYENTKVFVFSDDIPWAKENLKGEKDIVFVEANKNVEDLFLMSLCRHNIIANSSFSWWGAWLNKNESKIVIAPENWFRASLNTKDLIPDSFIKL